MYQAKKREIFGRDERQPLWVAALASPYSVDTEVVDATRGEISMT